MKKEEKDEEFVHIRNRLFLMHTNVFMILNWRTKCSGVRNRNTKLGTRMRLERGEVWKRKQLLFKAHVVWLSNFSFYDRGKRFGCLRLLSSSGEMKSRNIVQKVFKIKCSLHADGPLVFLLLSTAQKKQRRRKDALMAWNNS